MRVLFIKPNNLSRLNISVTQPLGIMYIASYIRKMRNDEVMILDLRCFRRDAYKVLQKTIKDFKPDVIGISCLTIEAEQMGFVAALAKNTLSKAIVIVGGPHSITHPVQILEDNNIDYIIMGEGEESFYELLNCIENSIDPANVESIGFRKNGETFFTKKRINYINLELLPYPAWDLINMESYYNFKSMSTLGPRRYMCLFTSRGCPYNCIYCHNIFGKKFRARTVDNIVEEIKTLRERYGISEFEIIDDCFNFDKRRTTDFLNRLINENMNINISFPNGLRADLLDEDLIELMSRSGVNWISFAVETASERMQKLIKKNLDISKTKKIIESTVRKGIFLNCFFMLGFPGETEQEIKETIKFAVKSSLCQALFFLVVPYENTGLRNFLLNTDINNSKSLQLAKADYFDCHFNLSLVSNKRLLWLHRYAYIRFYFSFRRILYLIRFFPKENLLTIYMVCKMVILHIFHQNHRKQIKVYTIFD